MLPAEEYCSVRRLNGEVLHVLSDYIWKNPCTNRFEALPGLCRCYSKFKDDSEIETFIKENVETVIKTVVLVAFENGEKCYILNINPMENFGPMDIFSKKRLAARQIVSYSPIIRYFLRYGFEKLGLKS